MELCSARVSIRSWRVQDEELADLWPPYDDPLDSLWNLPRSSGSFPYRFNGLDGLSLRWTWAVEDYAGRLAGRISLREVDERRRSARLGVTFGAPFVGRGLGTEALAIFLDHYFTRLGFLVMVLDVAAPNQRAVRCYRRLGFRHISSDWRPAGMFFDARILGRPDYAHLRTFFRSNASHSGLEVEFFEMELRKDEWFASRR